MANSESAFTLQLRSVYESTGTLTSNKLDEIANQLDDICKEGATNADQQSIITISAALKGIASEIRIQMVKPATTVTNDGSDYARSAAKQVRKLKRELKVFLGRYLKGERTEQQILLISSALTSTKWFLTEELDDQLEVCRSIFKPKEYSKPSNSRFSLSDAEEEENEHMSALEAAYLSDSEDEDADVRTARKDTILEEVTNIEHFYKMLLKTSIIETRAESTKTENALTKALEDSVDSFLIKQLSVKVMLLQEKIKQLNIMLEKFYIKKDKVEKVMDGSISKKEFEITFAHLNHGQEEEDEKLRDIERRLSALD